jgi:bifunctional non-homologous end joining protein LigD
MFEVKEKDGSEHYLYLDSLAGLLSIVQMGVLELHVWGSRIDRVDQPDRLIFDLDPAPELTWDAVVRGAKEVRDRLTSMGLTSFVKTTGGKGLHVVVPITRGRGDWEEMKAFTKAFAVSMAGDSPNRYVANMSKAKRTDKIFIDYLRNARGATAACAFTTRNRPGATVATPVTWEELDKGLSPTDFTVETVPARLDALTSDPWEELASVRQTITAAMKQRVGMR